MVVLGTHLPLGIVKGLGALEGTLTTYGTYFSPFLLGGGKKKKYKKRRTQRKKRSKGKKTKGKKTRDYKCKSCKRKTCKCNNKHTKRNRKTRRNL